MGRHRHLLPLSAGMIIALAACSGAAAPALQSPGVVTPATSVQPESSGENTATASTEASGAAIATPEASTPAAASTAAPDAKYDCQKLITDAEMQAATGLSSAAFFRQELWTDTPGLPEGQTYCQFFGNQGAVSIAVSVMTGPAYTQLEAALANVTGLEELPGIGEHATLAGTRGGARSHGVAVTVAIGDTSGGSGLPKDLVVKTAIANILTLVIGRV